MSRTVGNDGIASRGCKDGDKIEQCKPAIHEGTFFCFWIKGLICEQIV
jgi:hypothetical protein